MMSLEDWLAQCKVWAKNNQWELIALSAKKRQQAKKDLAWQAYNRRIGDHDENKIFARGGDA